MMDAAGYGESVKSPIAGVLSKDRLDPPPVSTRPLLGFCISGGRLDGASSGLAGKGKRESEIPVCNRWLV